MARKIVVVVGGSIDRWNICWRLAGVRWTLPVGRVARGGDGRGVRRPHRRRAARDAEQKPPLRPGCRGDHLLIGALKAKPAQGRKAGAIMRREDRLEHAELAHEAHLGEALERGRARVRHLPAVRRARDVPRREPRVVVRRPDEPVELSFAHAPRLLCPAPARRARAQRPIRFVAPPRRGRCTRGSARWRWRRRPGRRRARGR